METIVASAPTPRKAPRQRRSTATVEAIHQATLQLLLQGGAARLTTTRVAERAGVSVGTLYQYYSDKQALLFALLDAKLNGVEAAMSAAIDCLTGQSLDAMATGLADAWLGAKTQDIAASRAIYAVAAGFDITERLARDFDMIRGQVADLLRTPSDAPIADPDPDAAALMLVALVAGSTRVILERGASPQELAQLRRELPRACRAYLSQSAIGPRSTQQQP